MTTTEREAYDAWKAIVDAAEWDCAHGVRAGSLARPRPLYGPRCALCRHAGYVAWRRVDQIGKIPAAWL